MLRHVVFIGAPGVGKGTFAGLICKTTGWQTISIGEKMREEVRSGTELGFEIASRLKKGELIEDEVVNALASKHMDDIEHTAAKGTYGEGVILDGYPRTVGQSEALVKHCQGKDASILAVNIRLDKEVATRKLLGRRLCENCHGSYNTAHIVEDGYDMPAILPDPGACGCWHKSDCVLVKRDDDTPESIKHRLGEYALKTTPIIKFFEDRGILEHFDVKKGVKDTPALLERILRRLSNAQ